MLSWTKDYIDKKNELRPYFFTAQLDRHGQVAAW